MVLLARGFFLGLFSQNHDIHTLVIIIQKVGDSVPSIPTPYICRIGYLAASQHYGVRSTG
jgi:hypothetical protein